MTIRSDDMRAPAYQRRIGNRYPIRVDFTWEPASTRRWKRKSQPLDATTDNVSLSGLGFEAATHKDIVRGSPIRITIGDVVGAASVKLARPGEKPGVSYYGVEFRDQNMVDAVNALITEYEAVNRADDSSATRPQEFPSVNQYYIDDAY